MDDDLPELVDLPKAEVVEVQIALDGKTLWVNIDGQCRLRVARIENFVLDDQRMTISYVAEAIRRNRYLRSAPRGIEPDADTPFTQGETLDAMAVIAAIRTWKPKP